MISRRSLLASSAALGGASLLPGAAFAKGGLIATTYPGTWEDAYRSIVMPALKKKDDIDLELAPLFAMDQVGKAKAALKGDAAAKKTAEGHGIVRIDDIRRGPRTTK